MAMNEVSAEHRRDYTPYPTNRVLGTVGDAGNAEAAIDALLQAGFDRKDIDILHGEEDLERLDPAGANGFLTQFRRTVTRTFSAFEEFRHLTHDLEDVRAGRFVIMVTAKRRAQRIAAADILNRHGAEFVEFYGRWAWEDLSAPAQISPQDIPALFARAWNNRDPDALAALFDEDAEFVNVTGLWWHDRESIRNAHANGLERTFNTSTLATDATKVKLLSPDIAVVHARMTLSGEVPRTTIVSFVVHRTARRWLCASAHTTDVS
ncbi:MAG TPA: SgcJ/EcaC family oxidoreductase [Vicinamibacterales bacterium]|nr:SgcJ/EcaC family oxidoreductase [Vicinamibacterales bacterium]